MEEQQPPPHAVELPPTEPERVAALLGQVVRGFLDMDPQDQVKTMDLYFKATGQRIADIDRVIFDMAMAAGYSRDAIHLARSIAKVQVFSEIELPAGIFPYAEAIHHHVARARAPVCWGRGCGSLCITPPFRSLRPKPLYRCSEKFTAFLMIMK